MRDDALYTDAVVFDYTDHHGIRNMVEVASDATHAALYIEGTTHREPADADDEYPFGSVAPVHILMTREHLDGLIELLTEARDAMQ